MSHFIEKVTKIIFLIFVSLLVTQSSFSQVALDKSVSRDSLLNYLNQKLNENTIESAATLKSEAAALRKSKDEEGLILATKLYRALGNEEVAKSIENDMLKKFPKGVIARDQAYNKVFTSKPERPVEAVEKDYLNWLKTYPASSYTKQQREIYDFALSALIRRFTKVNNKEKVDDYLSRMKVTNLRVVTLLTLGKDYMSQNEAPLAVNYLAKALKLSKAAKESTDPKLRNSMAAMGYGVIVDEYSAALLSNGQTDESIKLSSELLAEQNYEGMNSGTLVQTLAKGLTRKGEQLNAFLALDTYLHKNPQSPEILGLAKDLYLKLNGDKSDFQEYLDLLRAEKQAAQTEHLKNVMVKEKAPLFSLYNRKGELVNLADYKGKLVVLDFWATWCVPCKKSFPGMQAVLDKYKDRKDVEFLFIDTWETAADFEKSVNELMDENNYTFNVLYDKQRDKNEETAVKKYGISAIPAKFVIDKNGYIRFKVSNSNTDKESVLSEMSAMIDMVLKE